MSLNAVVWNKRICDILCISNSDLLNVYLIGSQSTNDDTKHSDVDLIVVLSDDCEIKWRDANWLRKHGWLAKPTTPTAYKNFKRCYAGCDEFDIWGYSSGSFQSLLNEAAPFAVGCLFLNDSSKLKEDVKFTFSASPSVILHSFSGVSSLHLARAGMEFCSSGGDKPANGKVLQIEAWDPYKSIKTIYFSIWYLELAQQLLTDGVVSDRSAAVPFKNSLLKLIPDLSTITSCDWNVFMEVFSPIHQKYLKNLSDLQLGDPLWCFHNELVRDPKFCCCCDVCQHC